MIDILSTEELRAVVKNKILKEKLKIVRSKTLKAICGSNGHDDILKTVSDCLISFDGLGEIFNEYFDKHLEDEYYKSKKRYFESLDKKALIDELMEDFLYGLCSLEGNTIRESCEDFYNFNINDFYKFTNKSIKSAICIYYKKILGGIK